ncbi:carbohydrate esterase family 5 protein [Aaosphaeria arxii CBS 175.79]|uniref:Carbohydrate esterase family 5 protein n=1 Tax=Aaosphaeria arxii CBS 175.79 TaxID=1450172 RepID=A0A6A5Y986_9PLEO|nr:carbohydrate esterase family 5 protein [Aaosphaeria arxii CBS 175.79]KAF2021567.1 carbohydrate esterase family 5 protein [Aaosphaeria arxii CBS 175.79]
MKATIASTLVLLRAALTLARCDNGPCDDPAVLGLATSDCQKHHIFTARGSTAPRPGHAGELIRQVCEGLDDCGYEEIDYPASGGAQGPGAWCKSAHEGALNGQKQMTEYAERCPDAKLIVIGFSQGGSVVLDMIAGGGDAQVFGCHQEQNGPLDKTKSPANKVAVIASFGPTVRSAGNNYTLKGGENYDGQSKRIDSSNKILDTYAVEGRLRAWCNFGDPICAKGSQPSDVKNHLNYFINYTEEGAQWIIETVKNGGPGLGNPNVNPVSSTSLHSPASSASQLPSSPATVSTSTNPVVSATSPPKAAGTPSPTPTPNSPSFGIPTISVARNTWFLCGAVIMGSLFFLS